MVSSLVDIGRVLSNKYLTRNSDVPTIKLQPQGEPSPLPLKRLSKVINFICYYTVVKVRETTMRTYQPAVQIINQTEVCLIYFKHISQQPRIDGGRGYHYGICKRFHFIHFELYEKSLVDITAFHVTFPENLSTSYCYKMSKPKPAIGSSLLLRFF